MIPSKHPVVEVLKIPDALARSGLRLLRRSKN